MNQIISLIWLRCKHWGVWSASGCASLLRRSLSWWRGFWLNMRSCVCVPNSNTLNSKHNKHTQQVGTITTTYNIAPFGIGTSHSATRWRSCSQHAQMSFSGGSSPGYQPLIPSPSVVSKKQWSYTRLLHLYFFSGEGNPSVVLKQYFKHAHFVSQLHVFPVKCYGSSHVTRH